METAASLVGLPHPNRELLRMKKILFVDDDENILGAFQRQFRKQFSIETALGPEQGLTALESGDEYAAVVVDMNMPGMNGVEFLKRARARNPNLVRIVLTGNADQATAVHAVNEGHIFRFLNKPCSPEVLSATLQDALRQHDRTMFEKELLRNTLMGSVKVLSELLSMASPSAFERSRYFRQDIAKISRHLGAELTWEMEVAAMLSQIGCMAIPPEILQKARTGQALSSEEKAMIDRVPEIGHHLLGNIPRMEGVARIILYQNKQFDGVGFPPEAVAGDQLPMGSRMLKFLSELYQVEATGVSRAQALKLLHSREGHFDPSIFDAAVHSLDPNGNSISTTESIPVPIAFHQLHTGMILASNVETSDGSLIVCAGNEITQMLMERLRNFSTAVGLKEPIYVYPASTALPRVLPHAA